jgi:hypothetical protein
MASGWAQVRSSFAVRAAGLFCLLDRSIAPADGFATA